MAYTITGDTPEAVAFGLMQECASLGYASGTAPKTPDELLALYTRCLSVVRPEGGGSDRIPIYRLGDDREP